MAHENQDFKEIVLSGSPLRIRRRVAWGECDAVGVVYTPRFADYATEAALWFIKLVLRPHLAEHIDSPMKGMRFVFHRTLKIDELFEMCVRLIEIRQRTFDLEIRGTDIAGGPRFTAILSPILVDRRTFTSVPIPPGVRALLEDYKSTFSSAIGPSSRSLDRDDYAASGRSFCVRAFSPTTT
jgi:acyl-CoA thioester hydrolase